MAISIEKFYKILNKESIVNLKKNKQDKWWNKIIPKVEEGQVTPNGISYKTFGNNFYIMLRIYNFRARLGFKYSNLDWDMETDQAIKKTSLGLTLNLNYN